MAFNTLGGFFLARSRLDEAEAAYLRVIALTPDNTRGYNKPRRHLSADAADR
jgi:hypothetical protein